MGRRKSGPKPRPTPAAVKDSSDGAQPEKLLPYQLRNLLAMGFPLAHWYVIHCCANDCTNATDEQAVYQCMQLVWKPRARELVQERAVFKEQLQREQDELDEQCSRSAGAVAVAPAAPTPKPRASACAAKPAPAPLPAPFVIPSQCLDGDIYCDVLQDDVPEFGRGSRVAPPSPSPSSAPSPSPSLCVTPPRRRVSMPASSSGVSALQGGAEDRSAGSEGSSSGPPVGLPSSAKQAGKKKIKHRARPDLVCFKTVPPPVSALQDDDAPAPPPAQKAAPQGKRGGLVLQAAPQVLTKQVSPARMQPGVWLPCTVEKPIPGIVVMRNAFPPPDQQRLWDLAMRIGTPTGGHSAGWFKVMQDGTRQWNHGLWGQMHEPTATWPRQVRQLYAGFLAQARREDATLPHCDANLVLSNFYPPDSEGIYWHRDNSPNQAEAVEKKLPVLSISIGHSTVFSIMTPVELPKGEYTVEKEMKIQLNSGDVLVFGGPARKVKHRTGAVFPSAKHQRDLRQVGVDGSPMPGRLNLTFREQEGNWR
eukprot:TRINITY_DN4311_c0_g2_i1.p1 TRINITY_DN4311_c0_g2~~TRINITY_DN4311_c0_g2_i1.p1  ORF type:complete len:566 (+),score=155.11 TRINITY_DN4311_c0_g2_i1:102-1700(+)